MTDPASATELLTAGIGAVTAALCVVCRLLWTKSETCERDRSAMRILIESLIKENGLTVGTLTAFKMCPDASCPFKAKTFSLAQIPSEESP